MGALAFISIGRFAPRSAPIAISTATLRALWIMWHGVTPMCPKSNGLELKPRAVYSIPSFSVAERQA